MITSETEPITGELVSNQIDAPIIFSVTNEAIHFLRKKLKGLKADSNQGYKAVQAGISETRMLRGSVETTRKKLKESALIYGRLVDGEAKRITGLLDEIEEPLKLEKKTADEAKETAKREVEEAKKRELTKRVDALREFEYFAHPLIVADWTEEQYREELLNAAIAFDEKKKAAEAFRLKAIADEAERIETLRIEREVFEAERSALAAEKAAYEAKQEAIRAYQAEKTGLAQADLDAIQAKIDERNRIEREHIDAERAELQRQRDEIAERERIERVRIEAEQQAAQKAQHEADEAARLEAMKPDVEKIRAFGDVLRLLNYPILATKEGITFLRHLKAEADVLAISCEGFAS